MSNKIEIVFLQILLPTQHLDMNFSLEKKYLRFVFRKTEKTDIQSENDLYNIYVLCMYVFTIGSH